MDTSAFAVRYLSLNETEYIDGGITQTVLDKMVRMIRGGTVREVYLSMSEYGGGDDEDFLNVDLAHGWAVPAFNYWDEEGEAHMLLPVNGKYSGGESAPVEIGGQTPVLKRNALDDLDLAAECVLHFARTGTLYPGLEWEEFE
ncbi:Imm1 family immunity protein [Oscillospiraceae bacterium 44-5]